MKQTHNEKQSQRDNYVGREGQKQWRGGRGRWRVVI